LHQYNLYYWHLYVSVYIINRAIYLNCTCVLVLSESITVATRIGYGRTVWQYEQV